MRCSHQLSAFKEILVCFAVKEESAPFEKRIRGQAGTRVLVTGMGQQNAESSIRAAFAIRKPGLVLTCGFAGGLAPELRTGQIVFSTKQDGLTKSLAESGAKSATFFCASRVAGTSEEKRLLRQRTGADAVEMESEAICNFCQAQEVPSAIVRVVLDEAQENLPLDFNRVMTAKFEIDYVRLAMTIVGRPGLIPSLLRFQKQARHAAERLAEFLDKVIARLPTNQERL
jgi:nucleoside phosphorylase